MEANPVYILCLLFGHALCSSNKTELSEIDLHQHLFTGYNPDVIPNLNRSEPILIKIEMFLVSIENIDEKKQSLTARAFLQLNWRDDYLTWDPDKYHVGTINVKNSAIWMPDITLKGTLDPPLDIGQLGGRAVINHDGGITMWPYKTHHIACNISVSTFPLDKQVCVFDFSSWTNPTTVIRLKNPSGNIQMIRFSESGEWAILNTRTGTYQKEYDEFFYEHQTFILELKRKWLFHALNVMAPVVCISILNVFCFLLPAQSGERVTLCISIFLTLAVFLTVISSSLPESSDEVSIFGVYVGLQLFGSAFTIIATVLAIYFFHKSNRNAVPVIFKLLVKCCCVVHIRELTTHVRISQADSDSFNHVLPDSEKKSNERNCSVFQNNQITWRAVSIAVDRFCFASAVCWHVSLTLFLIFGLGFN